MIKCDDKSLKAFRDQYKNEHKSFTGRSTFLFFAHDYYHIQVFWEVIDSVSAIQTHNVDSINKNMLFLLARLETFEMKEKAKFELLINTLTQLTAGLTDIQSVASCRMVNGV